ncbi:hypothetical protein Q7C36_004344 [Tachysurus vachellii]|uniref:Ig-like domain-containing protein n=1 Tax=Tachysurus vachellii TaxID=175792 RepID=A0AA88T5Y5_TACVA|nr:hypothetical protein Q7C36_004344 [Tachysurus vachellii]
MSVRYSLYQSLLHSIFVISTIFILRCICQVGNDVRTTVGYLGEQVVLKLDVHPKWKITSIRWSVYKNITIITIFQDGTLNQFWERFSLDTVSGDLTIANLTANDALKYRVDLDVNGKVRHTIYVQLLVQDQVSKPNITLMHSFLDAEKCVILLKCSSPNSTFSLSWKSEQSFSEPFYSDGPNVSQESVMWTSLNTNRPVSFTCIATDGKRNESSKWSGQCPDVQEQRNCTQNQDRVCISRGRGATIVLIGLLIIIITTIMVMYFQGSWCYIEQRQSFWNCVTSDTSGKEENGEDVTRPPDTSGKEENREDVTRPPDTSGKEENREDVTTYQERM